eukprot:TRINITY_DN11445_c0_g1_i1.p1 TRINITY_DN11445_c0_g1~~TRINITY_DN11445_c0_g1_i1.p1  ORF type:complete len:360 (+),score=119.44 TRINITY_DN11445_c0_g1_i1:75-1154(+)
MWRSEGAGDDGVEVIQVGSTAPPQPAEDEHMASPLSSPCSCRSRSAPSERAAPPPPPDGPSAAQPAAEAAEPAQAAAEPAQEAAGDSRPARWAARARARRRGWGLAALERQLAAALQRRYMLQLWERAIAGRPARQERRAGELAEEAHNRLRRTWWSALQTRYAASCVERVARAEGLKEEGNSFFKQAGLTDPADHGALHEAIDKYSAALQEAPPGAKERAVYYGNRAACWAKLGRDADCAADCSDALKIVPDNPKWLLRRSAAYERTGEDDLYKALEDAKRVIELEGADMQLKQARGAVTRLEPRVEERRKKQTDEAIQGLKNIGNSLLGHFGLSLDNFQTSQNPDGTYSINFNQNKG